MDHVNKGELKQAMDVLAQRIGSIQLAKKKGSSWEKAEGLELLPVTGTGLMPGSLLHIAQ
eukprot:2241771-Karenia_brevis.AAC.1